MKKKTQIAQDATLFRHKRQSQFAPIGVKLRSAPFTLLVSLFLVLFVGCDDSTVEPLIIPQPPTAVLSAASFPAGQTAINNSSVATVTLAYSSAALITLLTQTGTSSAPPSGLHVTTTGSAACGAISVLAPSVNGATIQVGGCTGTGTVGIQILAGTAVSTLVNGSLPNAASNTITIPVDNSVPATLSYAIENAVVGTANGNNIVTATFNKAVQALSPTNASGQFTVSGCTTTQPSVAIAMSVDGSNRSVATATLTGGACSDGDVVSVTLHLDHVVDLAGNVGLSASNPAPVTYTVTTLPVVTLASPTFGTGLSALNGTGSTAMTLTFANVVSTTLTSQSGSSAAPPAGVVVVASGGASCANVDLTITGLSGGSLTISGCTVQGSLAVHIAANVTTSSASVGNAVSATRTVTVDLTPPAVSSLTLGATTIGTTDGANTALATFSELIQPLSTTNANSEFTITGCTGTAPSVAIAMSDDGMGHSTATATLSGGSCADNDTIGVNFNGITSVDLAGNAGSGTTTATFTIDTDDAIATLAAAVYPGGFTAVNSGSSAATIALSYGNTGAQTLVAATGTSAAPPAGLTVVENSASCTHVDITGTPSTTGATISVSGCTGDGNIQINASAGIATSPAGGHANIASSAQTVVVQNTVPTLVGGVVLTGTPGADGGNTVTLTFNEVVGSVSSAGFTISGCATTQPTAASASLNSGGGFTVATVVISGGVCNSGDTVSVTYDMSNVTNLSGQIGSGVSAAATYTTP